MKKLYYILNFTWGIIMNIFGLIGASAMLVLGKKPIRHAGSIVFRTGHYWGGVSLGIFSFVSEESSESTLDHEFGHSLQNALFGPLFLIIGVCSFIRCQKFNYNASHGIPNEDYDAVWYEGQATEWGTKVAKKW